MDASKILCCIICALSLLQAAGAEGPRRGPVSRLPTGAASTGCYFIVLKDKTTPDEMDQIEAKVSKLSDDSKIHSDVRKVAKAFTAKLSPYALEMVRRMPAVEYIEEEGFAEGVQDSDQFAAYIPEWHLDRLDQSHPSLDRRYWPIGDGAGVDVYILDSGINYDHEEFEYRAKYPGKDPTDDVNEDEGKDLERQFGRDCNGHGTHVASLCGGKTYGTAKKVTLYSIRVLGCNNAGPWSGVLAGIDFAMTMMERTNRPSLISMSLSGSYYRVVNDAVARVAERGLQSIMAAGNGMRDSCSRSPASSGIGITVGGTREGDGLYVLGPGTNYGRCVDIFAPGERVLGADWTCNNCTKYLSGTSMSTPLVTGLAAILLGREPIMTPAKLKQKLIEQSLKNVVNYNGNRNFTNTPNRLATIQGACGERNSPLGRSSFHSPGFPGLSYPPNLNCRWLIGGELGVRIILRLFYLNLEPGHDRLKLFNGCCEDEGSLITEFTGDLGHLNYTFTSTSNLACLELITDGTTSAHGFNGSYTKIYAGTELVVPNPEEEPPPLRLRGVEDVQVTILMSPRQARDKISTLMNSGYKLTWISSYRLGPNMNPYFDFVATNSTLVDTVSYVEIGYDELNSTIQEMKLKGYDIKLLIDRIRGRNPSEPSYSVIFEPRDAIFESAVFLRDTLVTHESRVVRMIEQGYQLVSQTFCTIRRDIETTSVFVRDRRIAFGIPTPNYPRQEVWNNITFFEFTHVTLRLANEGYYPFAVEVYTLPSHSDSLFSVIYEERTAATEGNWFRWSLNTTATRAIIEETTRVSWDVYITTGYTYLGSSQHFIEFKRKGT